MPQSSRHLNGNPHLTQVSKHTHFNAAGTHGNISFPAVPHGREHPQLVSSGAAPGPHAYKLQALLLKGRGLQGFLAN